MTAPYANDTATLLSQTHRQHTAARLTHPDWADPVELDVESLSIGWDEQRAPRAQANLTCRVPDVQAVLDLIDPRTGVRVLIDAGYIRPGGTRDVHTIANLGLRERTVSRAGNAMTLTAASDEARAIDGSPTTPLPLNNFPTTLAAIEWLLTSALGALPPLVRTFEGPGGPPTDLEGTTDYFNALKSTVDTYQLVQGDSQFSADIYHDGLDTWVLGYRPVLAGTSALALKVGAGDTILASDTTLSRQDWANEVVLRYEWTDAANQFHAVDASSQVTSGPYAVTGPAGYVTYAEKRDGHITQAAATAAAAALLRRLNSRGRSFRLQAIAAWWLRPGMTVTVQLPTGPQERHLVSSVEFNADTALMDLTTRLPETVQITGE